MKAQSKPVSIPADIAAKCYGPDQFKEFDNFFRAVIAVPKAEADKQEAKWKRTQSKKPKAGNS